jgi:amidase
MHEELYKLDAIDQAALVAEGKLTALELVDAAIARIERLEPQVHALVSTAFEAAREKARAPLSGPLAGVPFLVKDLLAYPGQPHTLGSRLFAQQRAAQGSPFTQRFDAAGLITLGKTTLSELGLLGSTESALTGTTRNPWQLGRSAMGSSGGSAAAVACGMVPMAHASDGGGSIRIPASASGLFGFRPGRYASTGVDMEGLLIDHVVSRSVRDSALFLALVEAEDAPGGQVGHVRGPARRRLRIGAYRHTALGAPPEPEVEQALSRSIALCRELGHEVREVEGPRFDKVAAMEGFFTLAGAGIDQLMRAVVPLLGREPGPAELEPFTLALAAHYRGLPEGAFARAQRGRAEISQVMRALIAEHDVLLCPTMPFTAPVLGTFAPGLPFELLLERTGLLAGYTAPYTYAGVPAMSVPLFESAEGLPIGSHFAAGVAGEGTLLGLAYELEAAAPWASRWPALV